MMATKLNCGHANLLAALLYKDVDNIKIQLGLPLDKQPCLNCGTPTKKVFCSRECKHDYAFIQVACSTCDKLFLRRQSKVIYYTNKRNQQFWFCSRHCFGIYAGEYHGFTAHPEKSHAGGRHRKWDYSKVYELRDRTGWGSDRLSRALEIPVSTIAKILRRRLKCQ